MNKSLSRDVYLLSSIRKQQNNLIEALNHFNCNSNNLAQNKLAFDLCSMYMSQLGEAAKLLTDATKESFKYLNIKSLVYFRNSINHSYEKINKVYLQSYIFNAISKQCREEVNNRIAFCMKNKRA